MKDTNKEENFGLYYSGYRELLDGGVHVVNDLTRKIIDGEFTMEECVPLDGSLSVKGQCWHDTVMFCCDDLITTTDNTTKLNYDFKKE